MTIPPSVQAEIDALDTEGLNPGMSDLRYIVALAMRETARECAGICDNLQLAEMVKSGELHRGKRFAFEEASFEIRSRYEVTP